MLNRYIVERDASSAPSRALDDVASVLGRARRLLAGAGTGIVWVESFVAGGKAYSVYLATDESLVHAYTRARDGGTYRLIRVLTTVHPGSAAEDDPEFSRAAFIADARFDPAARLAARRILRH
jgi:hypothetical protein